MVLKDRLFRAVCIVFLAGVMLFGSVPNPAYASPQSSLESFTDNFWGGLGGVLGGAVGSVILCYTVDAAMLPFAPPAAAYLATICPAIGSVAGGVGGAVGVSKIARHAH